MLNRLDLRATDLAPRELAAALPRAAVDVAAALDVVTPLMADVRERGAAALRDAAERFDHVRPEHLRVPAEAIAEALAGLDPAVREALEVSIAHNRAGHAAQLPTERVTTIVPGGTVTQRWVPVRRVGLYVPGGLAVYPSSVVMNAVTAQVAGVEQVALASPPQAAFGGLPHPTILAACALLGVTEVYAVGGAQAIAMLAYGAAPETEADRAAAGGPGRLLCEPVDVVTGPGNVYVAAAKRAVRGVCGIDAEAGTTEVLVLADAVDVAVERRTVATRHSGRVRTALTGPQSGTVLVRDLDQGVAVVDAYAAEHLEIQTADAPGVARRVRNAGAVFVGPFSPVPLGDYVAGSNHVLPTGGTARFAAGLNVMAYVKPVQVVEYDAAALASMTPHLSALAVSEDLPAHGESARARQEA